MTTISERLRVACFFVHIREMRNPRSKGRTPISVGAQDSAKVSLVGTAQRPGRQTPLTGSQAREDLIESDSPEREKRESEEPWKARSRTRFDRDR
ncbi:hypothetical protein ACFU67_20015, partial [Streptomyces rhizosphaericola]|uniref:hypothetical protein n=1 Tax=Streptomyces rhizosphaericola TaxID=2564098 RepID=UPI00367BAD9A